MLKAGAATLVPIMLRRPLNPAVLFEHRSRHSPAAAPSTRIGADDWTSYPPAVTAVHGNRAAELRLPHLPLACTNGTRLTGTRH
jgi:hypothetical protein